ncbi:MAG: oxygenase MpaB family protein [Acidimicrobiales bacterium]
MTAPARHPRAHVPGRPDASDAVAGLARAAGALGRRVVGTPLGLPVRVPLRALDAAAAPVRSGIRRNVRRALGAPARSARRPEPDPDRAFLSPGGVARRVHGDLPPMVIGGLSALLLQSLHPLAMAGVAEHSNYADDPLGRLRRTAAFVGATTFGSVDDAHEAIARVQEVHHRVRGVAPDGRPYSAGDPELVTWVHVAEVWSFLRAAERFGERVVTPEDRDAYLHETAPLALHLGAEWVPRSVDEVHAYLRRVRPQLYAGTQAMAARRFLLRGVARTPDDRAVYAVITAAAVGLLPGWARRELRLPRPPLVDALVVTPVARAFCSGLRWAVPPARAGG